MRQAAIELARTLTAEPSALVIVAHGGRSRSQGPATRLRLPYAWQRWFTRWVVDAVAGTDTQVWRLRYRYRGWNGAAADAAADLRWALTEAKRHHPGVPVTLIGHSMGARACIYCADEPNVASILLLAPWIEAGDPIDSLAGKHVEIIHGTADRTTDPGRSLVLAQDYGLRFTPIPNAGHTMLTRSGDWRRQTVEFLRRALTTAREARSSGPI